MPLWEKPHRDEVFNNGDFLYSGIQSLTNFVAIRYDANIENLQAAVLRLEACTLDRGGGSGEVGIQIGCTDNFISYPR